MSYENITCEVVDRLATVTVNRPDKLNALSPATIVELQAAFDALGRDAAVGAVILIGSGTRAFIAGADIAGLSRLTPVGARAEALAGQRLTTTIEMLGKPVIAAINGFALGGGLELAMACTLRIAHTKALVGQPEVKLGIIPGYGGTQRLPRLVGQGKALELILGGEPIGAVEAHRIGLVDRLVSVDPLPEDKTEAAAALRDALVADAEKLARTILQRAPLAVRYAIDAVQHGMSMPLHDALHHEAGLFGLCAATEDFHEGMGAFLAKRDPEFGGR